MTKRIINLITLVLILVIMANLKINEVNAGDISLNSFGNFYFDYESQLDESYYDLVDNSSKEALRETLHQVISTDTKKVPYDDGKGHVEDAYYYLDLIEHDPRSEDNQDYVYCLLTGKMLPGRSGFGSSGTNVWNREHIWAKKYGFPTGYNNNDNSAIFSDLNNLRAADYSANSAMHNDRQYNDVLNPLKVDDYGNKRDELYYEPRESAKGDIARIIMYMDIRYEGDILSDGYDLVIVENYYGSELEKNYEYTNKVGYMSVLSTLLKWHLEDPVDDYERMRNDKVFGIQNNRNPFIDHPEYANLIYGTNYQNGYSVSYYTDDNSFSYFDNYLYQAGSLIKKPDIEPIAEIGYKFIGWTTEKDSSILFDFDSDLIDNNLALYAKYEFIGYTKEEAASELKIYNSLCFNYEILDETSEAIKEKTNIKASMTNMKNSGFSNYDMDQYIDYDHDLVKVSYILNRSTGYLGFNNELNDSVIKLFPKADGNGNGIKIELKTDDIKIVDYKINAFLTTTTKLNSSTSYNANQVEIKMTDSSLSIFNKIKESSGYVLWITNIEIIYESTDPAATKQISFGPKFLMRYQVKLNEDLVSTFGLNAKYGYIINGQTYYVDMNSNYEINYDLEVIIDDILTIYNVKSFIQIDDLYYFVSDGKINSYSVKTLASLFVNKYRNLAVVLNNYQAFLRLSKVGD